jgi:hypothetical protein
MVIKPMNDRSPETAFVAFRNVDGSGSITQNMAINYLISGASVTAGSGNFNAVLPATAHLQGFGGIARSSVPVNGTGLATAFGYHNSILCSQEVGSITINAGNLLICVTATGGMSSIGGATYDWVNNKYAITGAALAAANISNAGGYFDNCTVRALN